jgi:two-component system, OmpR family, response regulator
MEPRAAAPKDDDIYAPTAKGSAELHEAGTSLSPAEIEVLVLLDGRAPLGQVLTNARGLTPEAARAALGKLHRAGYIEIAAKVHSDAIDAGGLFTLDAAHAAVGTLRENGYYVRIVRRRAHADRRAAGEKLAVLVIDDDPDLTKMLRSYLTLEGFVPRVARGRAEIVAALRQAPAPDLVLLDVAMPDADGFDVLARMRGHPALKAVPVIMLTAKATRQAVFNGIAAGADGYITKPFEIEVLMKAVRAVLGLDAAGQRERAPAPDAPERPDEDAEYGKRLQQRLARLEQLRRDLASGAVPASGAAELHRELHTIAGSAAMYGLPKASEAARVAELYLEPHCGPGAAPDGEVWARMKDLIEAVRGAARA